MGCSCNAACQINTHVSEEEVFAGQLERILEKSSDQPDYSSKKPDAHSAEPVPVDRTTTQVNKESQPESEPVSAHNPLPGIQLAMHQVATGDSKILPERFESYAPFPELDGGEFIQPESGETPASVQTFSKDVIPGMLVSSIRRELITGVGGDPVESIQNQSVNLEQQTPEASQIQNRNSTGVVEVNSIKESTVDSPASLNPPSSQTDQRPVDPLILQTVTDNRQIADNSSTFVSRQTPGEIPVEIVKLDTTPVQISHTPQVHPKTNSVDLHSSVDSTNQGRPETTVNLLKQSSSPEGQKDSQRDAFHRYVDQIHPDRSGKPDTETSSQPDSTSSRIARVQPQYSFANVASSAIQAGLKGQSLTASANQVPTQASLLKGAEPIDVQSLVQRIKLTLKSGQQELRLNLKPAVLGRAIITLHRQDDSLKLDFALESSTARATIENETVRLREALTTVGFQSVSINVHGPGSREMDNELHPETGEHPQHSNQHNSRKNEDQQETSQMLNPRMLGYNTFDLVA